MDIAGMLLVAFRKEPASKPAISQGPDERAGCLPAKSSEDLTLFRDIKNSRKTSSCITIYISVYYNGCGKLGILAA
jgi:hypothetical protein